MIVVELEGERERESTGLRDLLAQNYEKQDKKKDSNVEIIADDFERTLSSVTNESTGKIR